MTGSGSGTDPGLEPRTGGPDPGRLVQVIAGFARTATGDFSLPGMLADLATSVADVLDVDGAGVSYLVGDHMAVAHALPPFVGPVEQVQEDAQEGPCHDAVRSRTWVVEEDLTAHPDRWPHFGERAATVGLRAVASLPLLARGRAWGALDLYRCAPGPFAPGEFAATEALADVACGYVVMAHDREVALAAREQAAHAATHDPLTGLPNRALLLDRLNHAVATTARTGGAVAVVFIDLNGFKEVNDTHGHHAGDELLRQVAGRLHAVVREGDTLARWGGDEFVVVCESLHASGAGSGGRFDEHAVEVVVERLQASIEEPFALHVGVGSGLVPAPGTGEVQVHVRASVGVAATVPGTGAGESGREAESLLREADEAMYRAKRSRRARPPSVPGGSTVLVVDLAGPAVDTRSVQAREEVGGTV